MKTSPAQAGFAVKLHLAFMFTVRQPENGFICLIHNIHNANTHNKRKHHEITNRTNPYPHHPAHARREKAVKSVAEENGSLKVALEFGYPVAHIAQQLHEAIAAATGKPIKPGNHAQRGRA